MHLASARHAHRFVASPEHSAGIQIRPNGTPFSPSSYPTAADLNDARLYFLLSAMRLRNARRKTLVRS